MPAFFARLCQPPGHNVVLTQLPFCPWIQFEPPSLILPHLACSASWQTRPPAPPLPTSGSGAPHSSPEPPLAPAQSTRRCPTSRPSVSVGAGRHFSCLPGCQLAAAGDCWGLGAASPGFVFGFRDLGGAHTTREGSVGDAAPSPEAGEPPCPSPPPSLYLWSQMRSAALSLRMRRQHHRDHPPARQLRQRAEDRQPLLHPGNTDHRQGIWGAGQRRREGEMGVSQPQAPPRDPHPRQAVGRGIFVCVGRGGG